MTKIFIDVGHGGSDPGAVGNGLREKDLNLTISKKIKKYLDDIYTGHTVRLSRTSDQTLSLKQRTDMANKWGADYLLSVHINAGGGTGYEDFIHNNLSNTSNTAKLRDVIHAEIIKEIGGTNRGKKKANFHMLRESKMSAMLTENLFIDKKADADKLKDATFINKIVKGHAEGLAKAFNLKKISSNNPPTPTDDKRWRIQTGLFDNANSYSNALKRMADKFPWLLHENATTTELNPRYRIVTGLFTGKNVAEYHAEQLKKEFGWNVSVVKR